MMNLVPCLEALLFTLHKALHVVSMTNKAILKLVSLLLKRALCCFEGEIQTQNFDIYNTNTNSEIFIPSMSE